MLCCSQAKSRESFKLNNSKFVVGCIEPGQKRHRSCSCGSGPRWIIVIWHEFCGVKELASDHFKTIWQRSIRKCGWVSRPSHQNEKRKFIQDFKSLIPRSDEFLPGGRGKSLVSCRILYYGLVWNGKASATCTSAGAGASEDVLYHSL
jgi:hypothetical protein